MRQNTPVIAYCKSRNTQNKDTLTIIDFDYDQTTNSVEVKYLRRHKQYQSKIMSKKTTRYDLPIKIGERYIISGSNIYFIDDFEDVSGLWTN